MFSLAPLRKIHALGWGLSTEAVVELALAKVMTLFPAKAYLRGPARWRRNVELADDASDRARAVGRVVEAVARHLPFQARCLQQAVAVRRMLARRGLPGTLCLGVSTRREDRLVPRLGQAAHAWVCVGERVVCGDGDLGRYAVVARLPIR